MRRDRLEIVAAPLQRHRRLSSTFKASLSSLRSLFPPFHNINMAPIPPSSLVLVSGASGFIASWCCHELLSRGHRVRGTVRSADKGDYLTALFERSFPGQFTYVIAEDLEQDGVFDKAVDRVDGVLHTASPFHFNSQGKALEALINPAVKGTKSMLKSVLEHGKQVKRVIITSSYAAIRE